MYIHGSEIDSGNISMVGHLRDEAFQNQEEVKDSTLKYNLSYFIMN